MLEAHANSWNHAQHSFALIEDRERGDVTHLGLIEVPCLRAPGGAYNVANLPSCR